MRCQSGPGYISDTALVEVKKWAASIGTVTTPYVIRVDGEEDLLTLPIIYFAPVGTAVYYGQPHQGVVRVLIDDALHQKVAVLLAQFMHEDDLRGV